VAIGLVNFVDDDHLWTKASCGLTSTPDLSLDVSFCLQTIEGVDIVEIPDTHLDLRYANDPLVTGDPFFRSRSLPLWPPNTSRCASS